MTDPREVNPCVHRFTPDPKCLLCGLYNHSQPSIKTTKYRTPFHFPIRPYLRNLRTSAPPPATSLPLHEDTHLLLTSICDKFLFTDDTLALGITLFQLSRHAHPNEKFWASACLLIAAKTLELDKNVPYLNRYQRYADKSFSQGDYEQAERTILETLNFELQFSTFITFLDFYLTCGVLFQSDHLSHALIEFFEDDALFRAKDFLRKGNFPKHNPEMLALSIIKETRTKYNLTPWHTCLQELTGYSEEAIVVINTHESPLKELTHNNATERPTEHKDPLPRKKY